MVLTPIVLTPVHALQYRALMLQAYADCPDAFTSSVADREGWAAPCWWRPCSTRGHNPACKLFS